MYYEFTAVNYVHDCYVTNDTAFLNCGFDGLQVYNFATIPPLQLGLMDFYAGQGYNHSGWLYEDKSKYVLIDESALYIPNAFMVNGENPIFLPIVSLYDFDSYDLKIYDRWGGVIFQTGDRNEGWDGRGGSMGDMKPEGVYVYYLSTETR